MADNQSRFVIVNGVQRRRDRAEHEGLINSAGEPTTPPAVTGAPVTGPSESRTRQPGSVRKGATTKDEASS